MSCWEEGLEDGSRDIHWNNHTHTARSNYAPLSPALTCESLTWTGTGLIAGTNGFDVNQVLASPGLTLLLRLEILPGMTSLMMWNSTIAFQDLQAGFTELAL